MSIAKSFKIRLASMISCYMTLNEPPNFFGLWFCHLPDTEVSEMIALKYFCSSSNIGGKYQLLSLWSVATLSFWILIIKRKMNVCKKIIGSDNLHHLILPPWKLLWFENFITSRHYRDTSSKHGCFLNQTSSAITFSGEAHLALCWSMEILWTYTR